MVCLFNLKGMTLALAGTYLLVNFAPNITQAISEQFSITLSGLAVHDLHGKNPKNFTIPEAILSRPLVHGDVGELG